MDISYRPEFYRRDSDAAIAAFRAMINAKQPRQYDTLKSQLFELMLCRNPSMTKAEVKAEHKVAEHLKQSGSDYENYGVWVYYPWKNQVVHILDEEEFIEVRTNRNKYKITQEEQDVLRSKIVGIVGLSVGRAVATTIALERIAGEIRLADFDEIELSNLNRILAPLTEMGVNKTIVTAREIAELDPFIKVKCYTDGLTEDNMDSFFTDGKKLDLLVEECDDFKIKVQSRLVAQRLRVPVLMESNDRCLVDIERFDIEVNRPIFHNRLSTEDLSELLADDKCINRNTLLAKLIDLDNRSPQFLESVNEISISLLSWPQVGSEVLYGGSLLASIAKHILLGHRINSGRTTNDFLEKYLSFNG